MRKKVNRERYGQKSSVLFVTRRDVWFEYICRQRFTGRQGRSRQSIYRISIWWILCRGYHPRCVPLTSPFHSLFLFMHLKVQASGVWLSLQECVSESATAHRIHRKDVVTSAVCENKVCWILSFWKKTRKVYVVETLMIADFLNSFLAAQNELVGKTVVTAVMVNGLPVKALIDTGD